MNIRQQTTKTRWVFSLLYTTLLLYIAAASVWPACATAGDVNADTPAPSIRTTYTADLASQANPDGMMLMTGGYRRWIQETDKDGMPVRYVQTGMGIGLNPAYAKASIHGEWQPAVFISLHLEYDLYRFFGANGALLSFPDANAKFGKDDLKDMEGKEETGTGQRILFQPSFYAKAGPVVIINQTDLAYYRYNGDGPYFLDWEYDTLLKNGDAVIANRTQFLYPAWKGRGSALLYAGPYYEITHASDADLTRQRVGAQLYWIPADILWGMNKPRIYSQMGVNIQDRNRQGEMYMALGFGVDFNK